MQGILHRSYIGEVCPRIHSFLSIFCRPLWAAFSFVALLGDSLLRRARLGELRRLLIDSLITYLITLLDYAS